MNFKRTFLALIAFALLVPLVGCGRKSCCNGSSSFAPPPPCCPTPGGTSFSPGLPLGQH
jgi:hypothetical protein